MSAVRSCETNFFIFLTYALGFVWIMPGSYTGDTKVMCLHFNFKIEALYIIWKTSSNLM